MERAVTAFEQGKVQLGMCQNTSLSGSRSWYISHSYYTLPLSPYTNCLPQSYADSAQSNPSRCLTKSTCVFGAYDGHDVYTADHNVKVSLKEKTADPKHYEAAKKQVEEQGGKIVNEYKLVKGFTYVSSSPPCLP